MNKIKFLIISTLLTFLICGCGEKIKEKSIIAHETLITVTHPTFQAVEVLEETVGNIESTVDPTIVSEVSGKIEKVLVQAGDSVTKGQIMAMVDARDLTLSQQSQAAEVKRLETLLANSERTTVRYRDLLKDKYVSQANLDEAIAQEKALSQQLTAAKAQLHLVTRNVNKTQITAPVNARVESQLISEGGFVKMGDPIFQIVTSGNLRAHLPFPETAADRLHPGTLVRLSSPIFPNEIFEGVIKEIKPMISAHRTLEAIVEIENNHWKPGSSVNAQVIVAKRSQSIMVPEQSIVLRPAGTCVYAIQNNKAIQKIVQTGVSHSGMVEVLSGLSDQDTIAVDGAGFLTDQTPVKIQKG